MLTRCRCRRFSQSSTLSSNSSSKSFRLTTSVRSWQCSGLVLCLMVCGGNSQLSYSEIKSGECGSVSGRVDISDKATCDSAADSLGFSTFGATERLESYLPPGCFWRTGYGLYYNTRSSSTTPCSSTYSCLCLSAPECTKINGNEPNSGWCMCGTKECSAAGSYCYKTSSMCSTIPPCSEKDGLTATNAACQCGSTTCYAAGSYCVKSSTSTRNLCSLRPSTTCANTNGLTSNTVGIDCKCGSSNCISSSGYYCYADGNLCSDSIIAVCSEQDGLTANIAACQCGSTKCSAAGSYCDKSTSTCRTVPYCNEKDGLTANSAACQCGSTKCSAAGSYCDKSINICRDIPYCSEKDGLTANSAACQCGSTKCSTDFGLFCYKSNNGAARCDKIAHSVAFSSVKSGACGSVSGRGDIMDKAMCETAAGNLGLSDTTANEGSLSNQPSGCYWRQNVQNLYSNNPSCSSSYSCLCLSAPECTKINGNEPNNAVCICGAKGCSAAGSYCNKAISMCSTISSCSEKVGLTANSAACQCGSTKCSAAGSYCVKSSTRNLHVCSRRPSTTCANTNGLTSNTVGIDCKCGSSNCISSSGYYCYADGNLCSDSIIAVCSEQDGLTANIAACQCGSTKCSAAGSYCDKSTSTCRTVPYCNEKDGLTANSAACQCGSTKCSAAGSYCDKSINICRDIPYCSEKDGLTANSAACQCGSTKCSSSSGFYCTESTSTCAAGPPCAQTNGITANPTDCKCGSTNCGASLGYYCIKSTNTCSQVSYSEINSGTCGSVSGRINIADKATCETAASNLGFSDTTAIEQSKSDYPSGCYENSDGNLVYNTDSSSTTSCSSNTPCLCLSALECTKINGNEPNNAGCICGTAVCSAAGSYCDESKNKCSNVPTCGKSRNSVTCQCGSSQCTAESGLYCDSSNNKCNLGADCGSSVQSTTNCEMNSRCQCVKCDPKFYSSDCSKKCPDPEVSLAIDFSFVSVAGWIFVAYLYFSHRHEKKLNEIQETQDTAKKTNKKSKAAAKRGSKALNTDAAQQIKESVKSLQRLLVSRLQIIAAVLSSIIWSPNIPTFLIDILTFITNIFTINVPGLLTSTECAGGENGGISPLQKWLFSMFLPMGIILVFGMWYCCLARDSVAKNAVKEASIQVFFVWFFKTIVTTSLKILDCDPPSEVSNSNSTSNITIIPKRMWLMDPNNIECPIDSNIGLVVLGMSCLFIYFVPYLWLLNQRRSLFCCGFIKSSSLSDEEQSLNDSDRMRFQIQIKQPIPDSENFTSIFEWALKSYKDELSGFELWNVINRTVIIIGSTVMFPENRFTTHIIIMSWSLLLHLKFRPYRSSNSNIAAILFCLCDILGAVSAYQASSVFEGEASAGLQFAFILVTLFTLVYVGKSIVSAVRKQAAAVQAGLKNKDTKDMFATYTSLEKKLLFPILGIVWISVKLYQKFGSKTIGSKQTKITPTEVPITETNVTPDEANTDTEMKTTEREQDLSDVRNWGTKTNDTKAQSDLKKNAKQIFKDCESKQIFKDCDADGDGALDATEVRKALAALGCQMDDDAFNKMFQDCDKDHNGSINYKEFKKKL
jgi:hypothetical protein